MVTGGRNISLDVLRVLSMLFVVVNHSLTWGMDYMSACSSVLMNNVLYPIVLTIAKAGVDCFVLISAFFLSTRKGMQFRKVLRIWLETLFYSVLLWLVAGLSSENHISLLQSLTPFISNEYWFVTQYLIFLVLAPFLSVICAEFDKKDYKIFLAVLAVLTCTVVSAIPFLFGHVLFENSNTTTFIMLFFVAGYIARFQLPEWMTKYSFVFFLAVIFVQASVGILSNMSDLNSGVVHGGLSTANNGLTMLSSILLFIGFLSVDLNRHELFEFVAGIAPCTFAVYLIHDNPNVRDWLWQTVRISDYWNTPYFIFYVMAVSVFIFLVSVMIDYLKRLLWTSVMRSVSCPSK